MSDRMRVRPPRLPARVDDETGKTVPTGAVIEGVLEPSLNVVGCNGHSLGWRRAVDGVVRIDGKPVYIDDEGCTWIADDRSRWQPVKVELLPPQVTVLAAPPGDDDV